jgi:hypothetical protein
LAIVKMIADAHQARIALDSDEGVGTRFRVELPLGLVPGSDAVEPPARVALAPEGESGVARAQRALPSPLVGQGVAAPNRTSSW